MAKSLLKLAVYVLLVDKMIIRHFVNDGKLSCSTKLVKPHEKLSEQVAAGKLQIIRVI